MTALSRQAILRGLPASPGLVRGRAKVLRSARPREVGDVVPGMVLVAPYTTPFLYEHLVVATALVTDQGGLTCHAAQIARELGIPCVVGTQRGTSVVRDGMEITVDGTAGVVYRNGE